MNNIVKVSDFRNNISDYLNRIIYKNESFLIKKGNSIVAKVTIYKKTGESIQDKIKKYAGIWSVKDADLIGKYARKLRKEAKILKTYTQILRKEKPNSSVCWIAF
ncbi:hypothetical protein A2774_00595 [Candidatus Roizmanbacteria bacterium RIFCSPHIGHO2_01_FULL_39_12c]|uniref:Antitoxin n=1 Tax=Candidatus Roizmanbacteria bacterium RIFCSPHIGHO2_01_FULL_39_12c TaxID=1802031 RepID=A0A1F7GA04_9BACT|nr:MAG: hypothetical protein A2774_00595 [Candidatus Roizmanbacteria bacterium RIFCSPHIGHO2_01_FULL_39_12c]OGK47369.1 MAG: hypothetical protein A2963_04515 [Candidatus Roizmanbacteria bacterium RIFCSPLOWO2_01_FULL_40_13]